MKIVMDIKFNYYDDLVEVTLDDEIAKFGISVTNKYTETQIVAMVTWIVSTLAIRDNGQEGERGSAYPHASDSVFTPLLCCLCSKCEASDCPWRQGGVK